MTTIDRSLLADPARYVAGPPMAEFARRRAHEPVGWVDEPELVRHRPDGTAVTQRGDGFWAVTRYAAVREASRAPEVFSSAAGGAFLTDPKSRADAERTRQLLVSMDAPEHTAVRRVVTAAFTPRAVRELGAAIEAHAHALVGRVVAAGEFDAVADLAADLPLLVLADLLGMPREDRALLFDWSNNLVGFDDPEFGGGDVAAFQQTFVQAFGYALAAAADRRRRPGDDLVSRLVTAEVDGRRLTEREFCHLWLLLVVAGNETTRHLVSGTVELAADRPEVRAALGPGGDHATAVDELLRRITPIMQFRRTAVRDTVLDGQAIAEGDKVVLYFLSANHDESVFADPHLLDLARDPNPHLSFGVGPHFCLGAHLARAEAVALLRALAPHVGGLRRRGPTERLASNFMNGIKALPVAVTGGKAAN
ncbi:cytochrome P450 [Actinokineospora enzanensis]|uniref:cytochrome P450 n=1 Tax=Actinokineospora enzanensis TaxID=155975 RepID=UPI0003719442|nr:cytochrome P450 [Actinokineospora enzanensis]